MNESKWISVTERLPVFTGRYLAFVNGDVFEVVFYMSSFTWRACAADLDVHPTHWMPMPNPPPRQSSFEKFYTGELKGDSGYWKTEARKIWDAAEKAVLGPDYVP